MTTNTRGTMDNNRRLQICQQHHDKLDQMYYSQTHCAYVVSPSNSRDCILIDGKDGRYRSYADRYGALRDLDAEYADFIDAYLIRITGGTR